MESNPALNAILAGVTDPQERERIAKAFDSLSQGDEMSFPVVFALVANGTARSVAQSAALIKDCADCIRSAAAVPQRGPVPRTEAAWTVKSRRTRPTPVGLAVGLIVAGAGACGSFVFFKSRFETRAVSLATQYAQTAELVETLRATGGELRFYAARDEAGKTVLTLAVDGGTSHPREAFLNAAGQAIVLLEPSVHDPR
ncbi:MAG: hypothetical protein V4726_00100 [Verrucomicrobiota bacterium]